MAAGNSFMKAKDERWREREREREGGREGNACLFFSKREREREQINPVISAACICSIGEITAGTRLHFH